MAYIRFPNETEFTEIRDFNRSDFKRNKGFSDEIFGSYKGVCVALKKTKQ